MKNSKNIILVFLAMSLITTVFYVAVDANDFENNAEKTTVQVSGLHDITAKEDIALLSAVTEIETHVTGLDGVYSLTNRGNSQAIQNTNNNATSESRSYSTHSQLVKFISYAGNSVMGLPGDTYLIESISSPGTYLTASANTSVVFQSYGSFPFSSMLWYVNRLSNGTYRIFPSNNTNYALCAPMIIDTGYSLNVSGYSSQNTYMQWNLAQNLSWYSQIGYSFKGWESGVFDYANSNALTLQNLFLEEMITDSTTYEMKSLAYAISGSGCHMCAFSMIFANLDLFTQDGRYDVRCGYSTKIFSDPYATSMSNLALSNWSIASDGVIEGTYYSPMSVSYSRLGNEFNCDIYPISNIGSSQREKAVFISNLLYQHPEGIVLRFSGHSIVAVSSSYTNTTATSDIDNTFIVFDPGTSIETRGCYVTLANSGYSISDVQSIYYVEPNNN